MIYKFKGDASNSQRWREVKDQVLNKAMSQNGINMSLLEERQTLDEDLYKNSKGEVTASIQLQLLKKREEMEEKNMKIFGVLMKHIEPNSRAWSILGGLVKGSDPIETKGDL